MKNSWKNKHQFFVLNTQVGVEVCTGLDSACQWEAERGSPGGACGKGGRSGKRGDRSEEGGDRCEEMKGRSGKRRNRGEMGN